MSLPTSRDITINPGDPIPSSLLNRLQDSIDGMKKPSITKTISPYAAAVFGLSPWTVQGNGYVQSAGGSSDGILPLDLEVGDRLTGITVSTWGSGGGGDTIQFEIDIFSAAMADTTLNITVDTGRASAWGDVVMGATGGGAFTPHVLAAGEAIILQFSGSHIGQRIGNVRYTYDRL